MIKGRTLVWVRDDEGDVDLQDLEQLHVGIDSPTDVAMISSAVKDVCDRMPAGTGYHCHICITTLDNIKLENGICGKSKGLPLNQLNNLPKPNQEHTPMDE